MKLIKALFRIIHRSPLMIIGLWLLDFLNQGIVIITPYVIGFTIDGFFYDNKNMFWFFVLISMEILRVIMNSIRMYYDTIKYTQILREEIILYFTSAITIEKNDAKIAARISTIEELTGFIEEGFIELVMVSLTLVFTIFFLWQETTLSIVIIAILFSILCFALTYKYQKRIARNDKIEKNMLESELNKQKKRVPSILDSFYSRLFFVKVDSSTAEVKSYIISSIVQISLLLISIVIVLRLKDISIGMIYSTITYIYLLNETVSDLPQHYLNIRSYKDIAKRLSNE